MTNLHVCHIATTFAKNIALKALEHLEPNHATTSYAPFVLLRGNRWIIFGHFFFLLFKSSAVIRSCTVVMFFTFSFDNLQFFVLDR